MMTPDPLACPPLTGRQLCDYSDMPGYAIPPAAETSPSRARQLREEAIGR